MTYDNRGHGGASFCMFLDEGRGCQVRTERLKKTSLAIAIADMIHVSDSRTILGCQLPARLTKSFAGVALTSKWTFLKRLKSLVLRQCS